MWYFTRLNLPVAWSWSSVSTPIGDGRRPYMPVLPSWAKVVYSNCTTANTGLPFTPATLAFGTLSSEVPSGASEKNWRSFPGTLVSTIGWLRMS